MLCTISDILLKLLDLILEWCTNNTIYHRKPQYNNTSSKVLLGCHCQNRAFTLHENPKQRSINNCSSNMINPLELQLKWSSKLCWKLTWQFSFSLMSSASFLSSPLVKFFFFINFSELGFRAKLTSKDKFPDIIMHIVYFQWMKKMKIASWRRLKRNV